MSERFFSEKPISGPQAELTDAEAHHLAKVMRAREGDSVLLFDGSGDEFTARIERIRKDRVELAIVERRTIDRELPRELTLGIALPKGERQKWLLEKIVELGASRLVPLVAQRGVAQPVEQALVRLQRATVEASKQCGRNRLLEIASPQTALEFFAQQHSAGCRLLADPQGEPLTQPHATLAADVLAAIGPEGGFSPDEVAAARDAGWQIVSLGPRILRVETAAIALTAWVGLSLYATTAAPNAGG